MAVVMTTIFEALRADHDLQRQLVGELVQTQGESRARQELFNQLKRELTAHATHEERQFYVPLMVEDLTQDKARHSVAEHKELDDYVEQLAEYDMSAPQWLVTARELEHRLGHHLDEEEHEVFQLAGKALTDDAKVKLGAAYTEAMAEERRA